MIKPPPVPGPPTSAEGGSRSAILAAARDLFAIHSYGEVTIREIAARAEVSPALVMKCCGTKQDLFHATAAITPPPLPEVPLAELGTALVDEVIGRHERGEIEHLARALLLRLTSPDPDAVRDQFLAGYADPLAAVLQGANGRIRAELVLAALTGLVASLRILKLPASTADIAVLRREYSPLVQHLIDTRT